MFFVLGCFVMNQKSQNEADIYYIIAIGISAASCAQPMPLCVYVQLTLVFGIFIRQIRTRLQLIDVEFLANELE